MTQRPTPAIVSQAAVRALPRWAVALVCVLFLLPGFLGRDPWRAQELAALSVMFDMAWLHGPWLQPEVLGQTAQQWGLLPYWLGALSIQSLGWINAAWAAQLPFMGLTALTLWATWHSAFLLALQPAAQPVSFAFGGEAQPKDYARALADGALLLLVACLGLALLAHEITVDTAKLACAALWFLAWIRWLTKGHHSSTLALWTLGSLGLSLSGAPLLAAVWSLFSVAAVWRNRQTTQTMARWQVLAYGLPSLLTLWILMQLGWAWPEFSGGVLLDGQNWRSMLELLTWFTWPAGIFGAWAVWKWRKHWDEAHIYMPSAVVLTVVAASILNGAFDRLLLLGLPALAVLAALALPTLKRSVIALVDWFAVLFFSLGAVFIWVMWLAMMTGIPAKPAANVARLAPSFEPEFSWFLFAPALAATLAWLGLIAWRLGRSQVALWKPVVLSASGAMLCWMLLMTLWLPLLNHGMGLSPISQRIAQITGQQSCVALHGLPDSYVGGLLHHGQLQVLRASQPNAAQCDWLVIAPSIYEMPNPHINWAEWTFVQTLPRLRESRDGVLILKRKIDQ
jgi:hypothetical protein